MTEVRMNFYFAILLLQLKGLGTNYYYVCLSYSCHRYVECQGAIVTPSSSPGTKIAHPSGSRFLSACHTEEFASWLVYCVQIKLSTSPQKQAVWFPPSYPGATRLEGKRGKFLRALGLHSSTR